MESVEIKMADLLTAIKSSHVYLDYLQQKEYVENHSEIRCKINEYRSRNYALQNCSEQIDLFVELEKLEKEYGDLLKEEIVQKYLESESALCRMLQKVSLQMAGAVDIDLEYMQI